MQTEKNESDITEQEIRYQAHYRAHGCISVILRWAADGFREPKELIIKILSEPDRSTESFIYIFFRRDIKRSRIPTERDNHFSETPLFEASAQAAEGRLFFMTLVIYGDIAI